jgi:hypothetical protein
LHELKTAKVLVGLATPRSIAGRWLWIEGGIVWSRDPSLVRLFATPDIIPSQLIPFDHVHASFLDRKLRAQVKRDLDDALTLVGVAPAWTERANRLLGELLSAAAAPLPPPPAQTPNNNQQAAASSQLNRDEKTLRQLLLNLPTTVMDRFLEELRGQYILDEIFYYYEGFRGSVIGSDFQVFDPSLRPLIEEFLRAWSASLSFANYVVGLPGGGKFRLPTAIEMGDHEQWSRLLDRFNQAATEVARKYSQLIAYVKTNFPAIDLRETTKAAFKQRDEYDHDFSDVDTTPPEAAPSHLGQPKDKVRSKRGKTAKSSGHGK